MGKQEATVARSSRAKRKSTDQAAQPEAELQQPKAKKVKKQAEPAAAAEPAVRPKRDQKTSKKADSKPAKKANSKPVKKSDNKPKAQAKAEKKPKRQSKRKQTEAEEVSDADEEEQQQEEPEQSVHDIFMEEVHAKEKELNKHCLIMGQVRPWQRQYHCSGTAVGTNDAATWHAHVLSGMQHHCCMQEPNHSDRGTKLVRQAPTLLCLTAPIVWPTSCRPAAHICCCGQASCAVSQGPCLHLRSKVALLLCCTVMQVETDEDETTLDELRALTRVFVPEQVQDDFMEVRQQPHDPHAAWVTAFAAYCLMHVVLKHGLGHGGAVSPADGCTVKRPSPQTQVCCSAALTTRCAQPCASLHSLLPCAVPAPVSVCVRSVVGGA